MNIMSYLTSPAFEEFADAPVGTDQLAHNSGAPGVEAPGAAPAAEPQSDNLEIPESAGPALIATADEAQAAAVVDDPGHAEAEQAAQAATAENTAVIEQAEVAPAESAGTEEPAADPAADAAPTDAGGDVSELGADAVDGAEGEGGGEGDLSTDEGSKDGLGDEGAGDTGLDDTSAEGDVGADASADLGDDAGGDDLGDSTGDVDTGEAEEDGLGGDTEGEVTEGDEDGLGDTAGGDTEAGETETDFNDGEVEGSGETSEEETETEGEEESTDEEGEGESEEGDESESEETDSEDDADSDGDDGVEVDIPDVDTEADDEDAAEAEEAADEAEAEDEELDDEIVDTSKSIAELDDDTASVEAYIGALQLGCARKSYNVQTVGLAQTELKRLAKKFGSEAPLIPALEDYTSKNLDAYYTNSLESFSSFLKKIKHARDKFLDNFAQKMNEKMHLKAVETQIAAINTACDAQINRMKDLNLEGKVSITVPAPIRGSGGIIKSVTAELKFLGEVAGVFAHDRKFLDSMSKLLGAAIKEGDAVKSTSTIQKALKLGLPVKSYPAAVFSESALGGFHLERSEKKANGSMVEDMKSLGDRAIPTSVLSRESTDSGEAKQEITKADLIKMLRLAKVLVGLSRGTASAAGKGIVDAIDGANRAKSERNQSDAKSGEGDSRKDNDKAMNNMVDAFLSAIWNSADNYSNFQWHLITIADNLVHCVQKVKGSKKA